MTDTREKAIERILYFSRPEGIDDAKALRIMENVIAEMAAEFDVRGKARTAEDYWDTVVDWSCEDISNLPTVDY